MPRKGKFLKTRDDTEDVLSVIHALEASNSRPSKEQIVVKLMKAKKINEETARANIDCALCLGVITLLHQNNGETILADVLRLKTQRPIFIKSSTDLTELILNVLKEIGASNKEMAKKICEIQTHILSTYDIKTQNADLLPNLISKTIKSMLKKSLINFSIGTEEQNFRYYLLEEALSPSKNDVSILFQKYDIMHNTCSLPSTSTKHPPHKSEKVMHTKSKENLNKRSSVDIADFGEYPQSKGELKSLRDSLTAFFTPTYVRRSRLASLGGISYSDESPNKALTLELENDKMSVENNKELEIVIDSDYNNANKSQGPVTLTSSDGSLKSPHANSMTPSPHRRTDQLKDALSPYFSANNERRRKHEKGEYLNLSNGVPLKKKSENIDEEKEKLLSLSKKSSIKSGNEWEEEIENDYPMETEVARAATPYRKVRSTPKSQSTLRSTLRNSNNSLPGIIKNARNYRNDNKVAAIRTASILKKYCGTSKDAKKNNTRTGIKTSPTKILKSAEAPASSSLITNYFSKAITSPIRALKSSPVKPVLNNSQHEQIDSPWEIPEVDIKLYEKAREMAQKSLYDSSQKMMENVENQIFPPYITIGAWEIKTWYSSPYPQEYASLSMLHICESCLMYLADENPHVKRCKKVYPPGNEIYRNNDLSIFEVDGNSARVYCRNLCLLSKLFIDHKTLYFDVEPFLFYILTVNDTYGCHFAGYFSKEKYSHQKYNLACIVTLPCYQGRGYGRFLIEFSYLLSRRENLIGTPERPLSEMGKIAYQSYWKSAVFEFLYKNYVLDSTNQRDITLRGISEKTGIAIHDLTETFSHNGLFSVVNSTIKISLNIPQLKHHWGKAHISKSRIWLDESKLKWSPKVYTPSKDFHLRSPTFSITSQSSPKHLRENREKSPELGINEKNVNNKKTPKKVQRVGKRQLNLDPGKQPSEKVSPKNKSRQTAARKTLNTNRTSSAPKKREKSPSSDTQEDESDFLPKPKATCRGSAKLNQLKSSTDDEDDDKTTSQPDKKKRRYRGKNLTTNSGSSTKSPKSTRRNSKTTKKSAHKLAFISTDEENFEEKLTNGGKSEEEKLDIKSEAKAAGKKIAQPRGRKPSAKKIFPTNKTVQQRPLLRRENSKTSREETPIEEVPLFKNSQRSSKKLPTTTTTKAASIKSDSFDSDTESKLSEPQKSSSRILQNRRPSGVRKRRKRRKIPEKLIKSSTSSENSCDEEVGSKTLTPQNSSQKSSKLGSKTRAPRHFHHQRRLYRSSDEEDDDCCSSTSPQPMGDRLPIHKSNTEPETINMGGEPDTINMGGEPDENGCRSLSSMEVLSPKAPLGLESQREEEKPAPQKNDFKNLEEVGDKQVQDMETNSNDYEQQKLTDSIVSLLEEQQSSIAKVSAEFCGAEQQQHSQQILLRNNSTLRVNLKEDQQQKILGQQHLTCAINIPTDMMYQLNPHPYIQQQQQHLAIEMAPQLVQNAKDGHLMSNFSQNSESGTAFEMPVLDARITPVSSPVIQTANEDDDDIPPQLSPPIFCAMQDESKQMEESPHQLINENMPSENSLPVNTSQQQLLITSPHSSSNNNNSMACSSIPPNLNNENLVNSSAENLCSKTANDSIGEGFNYVQQRHISETYSRDVNDSMDNSNCIIGTSMNASYNSSNVSQQTIFSPQSNKSDSNTLSGGSVKKSLELQPNTIEMSGGSQKGCPTSSNMNSMGPINNSLMSSTPISSNLKDQILLQNQVQSFSPLGAPSLTTNYSTAMPIKDSLVIPNLSGQKKAKKSSKEKSVTKSKRKAKSDANNDHSSSFLTNPSQNPLLTSHSQFMNMSDYIMPNMQAMAQFAMTNGSNSAAMQSAYYNNAANYFGAAATTQIPSGSSLNYNSHHQQYPGTLNPFYNNSAAGWQHPYYGGYQNYQALNGMRSATGNEQTTTNNPSTIPNAAATAHNHSTTPTSLLPNTSNNWPTMDPFNGDSAATTGVRAPHQTPTDSSSIPFYPTPYPSQQYSSYNSAHS